MPNSKSILHSFGHAVLVLLYIELVSRVMGWATTHIATGGGPDSQSFVAFLLLVVISAAVMGILIFGRPVILFLSGQRTEAIQFLGMTLGFIVIIAIIFFSLLSRASIY